MLVWDDIHEISEAGDNSASEAVYKRLNKVLDAQAHQLYALLTA